MAKRQQRTKETSPPTPWWIQQQYGHIIAIIPVCVLLALLPHFLDMMPAQNDRVPSNPSSRVTAPPLKTIPVPVAPADLSVTEFRSRFANQLPVVLQLAPGQEAMNWDFEVLQDRCSGAYTPVFKRARASHWASLRPKGSFTMTPRRLLTPRRISGLVPFSDFIAPYLPGSFRPSPEQMDYALEMWIKVRFLPRTVSAD